jgi:hypothetical protein
MIPTVVTKDPTAVEVEVRGAYLAMFPGGDGRFVPQVFGWAVECFAGHYGDYQAVDARYHDLEHTLQGTLCLVRLLRGRQAAGAQPALTERMLQLGLLAILLHDTGYLKHRADREGTGAKYTITHVARSAEFAAKLLGEKGFGPDEIKSVQNMIRCTGLEAEIKRIQFQGALERAVGFALASADLLGQMAAEDYADKLPELYEEFAEAVEFTGNEAHFVASFASADDLMSKTPLFWEEFVRPKLERDLEGLWQFLNDPYPDGPNPYLQQIQANMARLKQRLAPSSR